MAYLNLFINHVKLALHRSRNEDEPLKLFGERSGSISEAPVTLSGIVEKGSRTKFAIDNKDFLYDDGTWVIGRLRIGAKVVMRGVQGANGQPYARSIVVKN